MVNFRYGRRGARLREGTKTPFPESLAKAEDIFARLVAEKTGKGYLIDGETGAPTPIPEVSELAVPQNDDPRITATIDRINRGFTEERWKLSRAIWRAGVWQLSEALPNLRALAENATGMGALCLAFALGRCGNESDLETLATLTSNNSEDVSYLRIAREAQLALSSEPEQTAFIDQVIAELPSVVRESLESPDFIEVTKDLIENGDSPLSLSADLYLISRRHPHVREALYSLSKTISPSKNGMLLIRQLFKAAEFRRDAEVYGALVQRFETSPSNGSTHFSWKLKKTVHPPFSAQTKKYFKRRVVRTLSQAGDDHDAATFIPLATGILLAYDDDLNPSELSSSWGYDSNYQYKEIHHPARKKSFSYLWILRGKSPSLRYTRSFTWAFTDLVTKATTREEKYPELWDLAPDAITHLLAQSRAAEVQEFAHRIWKDHPKWAKEIATSNIVSFLSSWFADTAELGFTLARERWNADTPDEDLLFGMLDCQTSAAQELANEWLLQINDHLAKNAGLLARLAFLEQTISQQGVRAFIAKTNLSSEIRSDFVARVISALLSLNEEDEARAAFASEIIRQAAPAELAKVPYQHLAELASHTLEPIQLLGTRILLEQSSPASLPEELLLAPLSSDFPSVRKLGLELLGKLSESELAQRSETLASCAVSPHSDLREHIRPLIKKIAPTQLDLCRELVTQWYPLLLRSEAAEGLHNDLYQLLSDPFAAYLNVIPEDSFPRMLESEYSRAQALGYLLLKENAQLNDVSLADLIAWSSHQHAELRHYIWDYFNANPARIISQLGDALPLLETDWEDSREKAFVFFRDVVQEEDWTPESLVAICDSTHARAQDFGREMMTRRFREEDGPQYLTQLSQHPDTELQIFASNYLMRFAVDQPERIELLEPYFRTVLSKIGAGRTAKQRIFALLEQESQKNEKTAQLVATLLDRISATIAIEDKATCITILLKLSHKWPKIPVPLQPLDPELRTPEFA